MLYGYGTDQRSSAATIYWRKYWHNLLGLIVDFKETGSDSLLAQESIHAVLASATPRIFLWRQVCGRTIINRCAAFTKIFW